MQAQATGPQRFRFNQIALLALAIGILTIAAVVLSDAVDLPYFSESQAVSTSASPAMTGHEWIRFLEQNVQLPNGVFVEPAQSGERMRFLEQNIWEYSSFPDTGEDGDSPVVPPVSHPEGYID